MQPLSFDIQAGGAATVVTLRGELDASQVPALEQRLDELEPAGVGVVIDLNAVSFLDSAGIALLVRVDRALAPGGRYLALVVAAGGPVLRALTVTGMTGTFPVRRTVDEAIDAIR